MALRITFHGGAESVTGSNFLIEGEKGKILIDCGLEQGRDASIREMAEPFPFDASTIDALVITHAHLDHIGRAPKLMREGFKGKVYATHPTLDLMDIMLRDSVSLLREDAAQHGIPPLYDEHDVDQIMARATPIALHEETPVAPGLSIYFRQTGHILGSVSVRVKGEDGTTLALTGDIGNTPNPYLPDAEPIEDADAIVMESVYGDRLHDHKGEAREKALRDALARAIARGGTILIPAFSIERTQLMLYEISNMMDAGELPRIPVFLDSPLAIKVTEMYERWSGTFFKKEVQEEVKKEGSIFRFKSFQDTLSREDSMDIDHVPGPKIILAGAGMSHGGRIGRHEALYLPDPKTTLFIVGYQAPGSPGRMLQDGAPKVQVNGRWIKMRAKVEQFSGWSAHADRDGLLEFAQKALPRTKIFFVTLGEPASARFLAQRVHDYLGAKAVVPTAGEMWEVSKNDIRRV
ncbi:MAG TPA: MBL fold metallo-hydrolase [Candidatus Paceibacterota bacterium]|nr:MBL fold metallo-hydrolase [Candidatus Paceibacterota bacterium]